jgi:hypothetical protein
MLEARVQEVMSFRHVDQVASDIRRLRLSHRAMPHADFLKEEVIHYRKWIEVGTRDARQPLWIRIGCATSSG